MDEKFWQEQAARQRQDAAGQQDEQVQQSLQPKSEAAAEDLAAKEDDNSLPPRELEQNISQQQDPLEADSMDEDKGSRGRNELGKQGYVVVARNDLSSLTPDALACRVSRSISQSRTGRIRRASDHRPVRLETWQSQARASGVG